MDARRSQLVVIDVQARLVPAMADPDALVDACVFLAQVAGHCRVPVMITEQYPAGLGHTVPSVLAASTRPAVVEKTAFSLAQENRAIDRLRRQRASQGRTQVVVCGVEAHVCVLQSALDLRASGFDVFVVADAITSRRIGSRDVALSRLAHAGIVPVTSEMVAFEWLADAKAKAFKPVSALVRAR